MLSRVLKSRTKFCRLLPILLKVVHRGLKIDVITFLLQTAFKQILFVVWKQLLMTVAFADFLDSGFLRICCNCFLRVLIEFRAQSFAKDSTEVKR